MTWGALRKLLRRQVNDVAGVTWADDEIDGAIDIAYAGMQKEIFQEFPLAHLTQTFINTLVGVNSYAPVANFALEQVGIKAAASDLSYTIIHPKGYQQIRDATGTTQYYTKRGQNIFIAPAPTTAIASGIEVWLIPIATIGIDTT